MISPEITAFLQERIDAGDFPSAVYLVAEKGEIVFQDALGYAVVEPERIEARIDTVYDLASLTKPLVTGLLSAVLIDRDELKLGWSVQEYLEEFDSRHAHAGDKWDIDVKELLTHRTFLPAWKPFYLLVDDRQSVLKEIVRTPRDFEMLQVTYSDLNFLTLTFIAERLRGASLDAIARTEILGPLGLKNTFFNPEPSFLPEIAASENGNRYEKNTCLDQGYLTPGEERDSRGNPVATTPGSDLFRDYQIWGEVHDGNAWFMGGVAGHAGLFSTAEETFKIAQQFLPNYTTLLKPDTCELFRTNFTPGMNEHRSFAFQLASTPESTAGSRMSPEAFGHLGFTGTSLWIDPVKERVFILLTNRTHAHPLPFTNINSVRRRFHDLANELLDKLSN
ncbi:MAG: serine hydrolase [Acidobacteriota bacterium]